MGGGNVPVCVCVCVCVCEYVCTQQTRINHIYLSNSDNVPLVMRNPNTPEFTSWIWPMSGNFCFNNSEHFGVRARETETILAVLTRSARVRRTSSVQKKVSASTAMARLYRAAPNRKPICFALHECGRLLNQVNIFSQNWHQLCLTWRITRNE